LEEQCLTPKKFKPILKTICNNTSIS